MQRGLYKRGLGFALQTVLAFVDKQEVRTRFREFYMFTEAADYVLSPPLKGLKVVLWPKDITARRFLPVEGQGYEESWNAKSVVEVHLGLKGKRDVIACDSWPEPSYNIGAVRWPATLRKATHLWQAVLPGDDLTAQDNTCWLNAAFQTLMQMGKLPGFLAKTGAVYVRGTMLHALAVLARLYLYDSRSTTVLKFTAVHADVVYTVR